MPNEVYLQRELIKAVEAEGGYGVKLSNRFAIGVPDLLLQCPGFPTVILECKLAQRPKRDTTHIRVELTELQKQTIKEINQGGGYAGWVVFLTDAALPFGYFLISGRTPVNDIENYVHEDWLIKRRGKPWPIRLLLSHITRSD